MENEGFAAEIVKNSPSDETYRRRIDEILTNSTAPLVNAPSKLDTLDVWWQDGVRSTAENLALDESLLEQLDERPVLRFYQWSHQHGEAWTMGYFQRWAEMPFATASEVGKDRDLDLDIARRWTGGGLVCHRSDFPYTLTVPADHWLAKIPATDSYRWIHERLAASIRESTGIAAVEKPVAPEGPSASPARACFEKPVHWDVIVANRDGSTDAEKKIAGAAQRRSRGRLLHQGSVILPSPEGNEDAEQANLSWRPGFVELLCDCPQENWSPSEELIAHAVELARDRYGSQLWRERF